MRGPILSESLCLFSRNLVQKEEFSRKILFNQFCRRFTNDHYLVISAIVFSSILSDKVNIRTLQKLLNFTMQNFKRRKFVANEAHFFKRQCSRE